MKWKRMSYTFIENLSPSLSFASERRTLVPDNISYKSQKLHYLCTPEELSEIIGDLKIIIAELHCVE